MRADVLKCCFIDCLIIDWMGFHQTSRCDLCILLGSLALSRLISVLRILISRSKAAIVVSLGLECTIGTDAIFLALPAYCNVLMLSSTWLSLHSIAIGLEEKKMW